MSQINLETGVPDVEFDDGHPAWEEKDIYYCSCAGNWFHQQG